MDNLVVDIWIWGAGSIASEELFASWKGKSETRNMRKPKTNKRSQHVKYFDKDSITIIGLVNLADVVLWKYLHFVAKKNNPIYYKKLFGWREEDRKNGVLSIEVDAQISWLLLIKIIELKRHWRRNHIFTWCTKKSTTLLTLATVTTAKTLCLVCKYARRLVSKWLNTFH